MLDNLAALDTRLFLWLNGHHSPFWDRVMWFASGKYEWIPLYISIVAYLIYRYRWQSVSIIIAVMLAITIADQLAVELFKNVVQRLRPTHDPGLESMVYTVNNYKGGMYGFISNHAANTFAFVSFLGILFKNKYFTITALFWASLVSYSRIYLGVHFPGDVVCGALFGILIGGLVFMLYLWVVNKIKLRKKVISEQ